MQKLTLQQYQEVIAVADNGEGKNAIDRVYSKLIDVKRLNATSNAEQEVKVRDYVYQVMAVANPLTREWAKANCVNDIRKFVWQGKEAGANGKAVYLRSKDGQLLLQESTGKLSDFTFLTETDLVNAGFNPDSFTKVKEYGVYD